MKEFLIIIQCVTWLMMHLDIINIENITLNRRETLNSAKEQKKNKKSDRVKKENKFSKLSDEIIHCILSTLDAKVVVQTSTLSKRLRYFWVFVSVPNFHDSSFEDSSLLEYFVHHFLSHSDPFTSVFKPSLECHNEMDDVHLIDFIIDS